MAGSEDVSREELLEAIAVRDRTIAEQQLLIERLSVRVEELVERVEDLERQLAQNSKNSSKPPSQDQPGMPKSKSSRRRSGRRPGKQPGGEGQTLRQVENPDEVIDHHPDTCVGCGADLVGAAEAGDPVRRQVFDIPDPRPVVTEHRMHKHRCGCGWVTSAEPPDGVAAPAVYGPNLAALAAYLVVYQHLPMARAAQLIADVVGMPVSTGWIATTIARMARLLADVEAHIKTLLTLAHILHVDETSLRVGGGRWWLHVASTPSLTAFHLHPKRGRDAIEDFAILDRFTGTTVHDCWAAYDGYPGCAHALCGAHLVRELVAAEQAHPDQAWPVAARHALLDLAQAAHTARDQGMNAIPDHILTPVLDRWNNAIRVGLADNPRVPGRKQSKTRNLLQRLRDREAQVLRFAHDLTVPFTNNQAERDLRPTKTQMKISGCHRSETGARNWLRIRSYISTARKQGVHVLTTLRDTLLDNPWKPAPDT